MGSLRFTSPYFLTFIQAKDLGGHDRNGELGSLVVKYGTYTKEKAANYILNIQPEEAAR